MAKKKAPKKKAAPKKAPKGAITISSPDGTKWALEINNEGEVKPQKL